MSKDRHSKDRWGNSNNYNDTKGVNILDTVNGSSRVFVVSHGKHYIRAYSYGKSRTREEAMELAEACMKQYKKDHLLRD